MFVYYKEYIYELLFSNDWGIFYKWFLDYKCEENVIYR